MAAAARPAFVLRRDTVAVVNVSLPDDLSAFLDLHVPPAARAAQAVRDSERYHVTVAHGLPRAKLQSPALAAALDAANAADGGAVRVYALAIVRLGRVDDANAVYYAPCVCPAAERLRRAQGWAADCLPALHITLGVGQAGDRHDVNKGLLALSGHVLAVSAKALTAMLEDRVRVPHGHLEAFALRVAASGSGTEPAALLRLRAACAPPGGEARLNPLRRLVQEWGDARALAALLREGASETLMLHDLQGAVLRGPIPPALRWRVFINALPCVGADLRHCWCVVQPQEANGDATLQLLRAPLNLRIAAEEGLLTSGACGSDAAPLLAALNVRIIVNLMETCNTSLREDFEAGGGTYLHLPTPDLAAPTPGDLERAVAAVADAAPEAPALVHCQGGRGRSVTVAAAWRLRRGLHGGDEGGNAFDRVQAALAWLRERNPRVAVTDEQRAALRAIAAQPAPVPDLSHSIRLDGRARPRCIVFCGLPGSGKSTLAQHLERYGGGHLVRVSQDDDGGRRGAERRFNEAPAGATLLVDRCNPTCKDRRDWRPARGESWLVWLDLPVEACAYRAMHRLGHPTLRGGPKASSIVATVAAQLQREPPVPAAEGFAAFVRLTSEADVAQQVAAWGLPPLTPVPLDVPDIVKFPRTRHLLDLGNASRDDLVSDARAAEALLERARANNNLLLVAEEKVDGANLSVWIDPETRAVRFQNRSHAVDPSYHPQFAKLTAWADAHYAALDALLGPEACAGGGGSARRILYGEWCAFRHSIHYTRLPDLFLAFDMLDTGTGRFWSRDSLAAALVEANAGLAPSAQIAHVPEVARGAALLAEGLDGLRRRVTAGTPSAYCDGPAEGLYVRLCDIEAEMTLDRAKLVRPDFICGNQHWTKNHFTPNVVV